MSGVRMLHFLKFDGNIYNSIFIIFSNFTSGLDLPYTSVPYAWT